MDFPDSDSKDTDSEELEEELESELYSVLHYNVLSDGISPELLSKYDIRINDQNEYYISLKRSVDKQEAEDKNEGAKPEPSISKESEDEIDIITISDKDDDSDVILNEPILDVTYVSSPSVVEINDSSCSSVMEDPVLLNISDSSRERTFMDVEEDSFPVKWKKVISPNSWTSSMKKYYNKPCEKLRNFNFEKIKQEIKGTGDWEINVADRFPPRGKLKRCTICRQTDHKMKNCPRKFLNCMMCGNPGHNDSNCPHKKCLNCGRRNNVFVAMCQNCERVRYQRCSECGQKGHSKYTCPDTWRRYHSTTSGELVIKEQSLNQKLYCCNCAQIGHLFENCPKLYWSPYPPTTNTIKNAREITPTSPKGKKFRQFEEDSFSFDRTPKVVKWNNRNSTTFDQASTSNKQSPRTPNFKKKIRYFQGNVFSNNGNLNNHSFNRNKKKSPKKPKNKKKKNSLISNNTF